MNVHENNYILGHKKKFGIPPLQPVLTPTTLSSSYSHRLGSLSLRRYNSVSVQVKKKFMFHL